MTTTDEVSVVDAAVRLWNETGHGVTPAAIAERIGTDEESVQRVLTPIAYKYFAKVLTGDDQVAVVREPTPEARRFFGA
ncbi:hypothetical protein [Mycolicibacterium sp. CR10]|uniref:hypothetical protein n=1 Tax=Mycolicibacterium sp. CR10 TaxID=2562314 RepID=UPI0010C02252|nr:hypothetical protein [Mycolicibacterium sp. CR10]